jgi:colanic acid/amylovoran biosynthesis glycosyltransferase
MEVAKMKSIRVINAEVITTFHGYDAHYKSQKELHNLQKRYKTLFAVSKYITVNTPYLAEKVKALGCASNKLRVIPMGVDLNYFMSQVNRKPINRKEIKLLSVGRLVELKGFEFAIRAIKILVDKGFLLHYTLIGDGELFNDYNILVKRLQLDTGVMFMGKQSQAIIKQELEKHDIFLMSSITDKTGRAEAQGLVTAEAQAMGLPVVAFKSGGVPYTIKDNETGLLVPEKDINAFAETIIKVLEFPELYHSMSEAAKRFAKEEFSNVKMTHHFAELYK